MNPKAHSVHPALVPVLLLAIPLMAFGQDVTRTVTTRTSTPEIVVPPNVTKTVTTRTSSSDVAAPLGVTKTVTTQTLNSDAVVIPNVTKTVTTQTLTPQNVLNDGNVTRTVTTKTTFVSPGLPHRGLFQIRGTSTYFWVDDFGIRHYLRDPDAVRALYLPNEPVYVVSKQEIRRLPTGRALSLNSGPSLYLTHRDETAVLLEKPRVIVEFGTGPNMRRVQLRDLKDLKAVEDFDDLEDLSNNFIE